MSSPDINQLLAQMRVTSAQAQNSNIPAVEETGLNFADMLKNSIDSVNETQQHANKLADAFETGKTDTSLAEVMLAAQKASVSFQAMLQVRNKLVDAYKDVMNMPL